MSENKYFKDQLVHGKPFNPHNVFNGIFIPNGLVKCPNVSDQLKILMGRLFQYAGRNGVAHPYRNTLAEECSWHIRKLDRIIKEAKDVGLLKTTQETEHSPSEYIFLYSEVYEGIYANIPPVKNDSRGTAKNDSRGTDKSVNQRRESFKKRIIREKDIDKSISIGKPNGQRLPKIVIKKSIDKPPKIVLNKSKDIPEQPSQEQPTPDHTSKFVHTTTDFRNYNEMKSAGATNHNSGTKAEIDSLDKLHALFSPRCKKPYHAVHIPEQYIDFEWDMDTLIEVFKYHLDQAPKYSMNPVRSIGKFILCEGFNGYKTWSPLLFWHQKMEKTAAGELTEYGRSFFQALKRSQISDPEQLDSTIINKVAGDLSVVDLKYKFLDDSTKNINYPFGLVDCLAKYVKEKSNNINFKLVYITKNGFTDEFLQEMLKRNVLVKKKAKRVDGEIIYY